MTKSNNQNSKKACVKVNTGLTNSASTKAKTPFPTRPTADSESKTRNMTLGVIVGTYAKIVILCSVTLDLLRNK